MSQNINYGGVRDLSGSCLNCKAKSHLFRLLSNEELTQINENRCRVFYKAGETIRKQGANLSSVISVTDGLCKMYLEGIESRNIILRIIKPNNFIGGPGLYVDYKHHFTVSALTDTTVCFIDTKVFKLIMDRNKEFANEFLQDMSKNMISIYSRIISLTQKQMAGRVADALVYFADDLFESKKFDLPLTNQEIADFTKMSKDNVVRIIKSFNDENIIRLDKKSVEILNYDKLLRISSVG
jgi:CRP-like cAMP-binding protein